MQKLLFSIPVSANITGTCVWLAGCKKEANQAAVNTDKVINKQSEADRITEQRIRSFRQQAKTNARVNENMAVADALWYMEATLNYTFCRGSRGIIDPLADTATVTLTETSAGMVEFTEVATQYNNITAQMQANVPLLEQNKRAYMLVDVMDMGSNNGVVTFRCIMLNGGIPDTTAGNARITAWTAFGPDDNWYYGEKLGRVKADGQRQYMGTFDATTVLTNYINTGQGVVYPWIPNDPNDPYYFSDVTKIFIDEAIITSNYIAPGQLDNIKDYYGFYRSIANSGGNPLDLVIRYTPDNEMNFYKDGLDLIKTDMDAYALTLTPPRTFKYCQVIDGKNLFGGERIRIFHQFIFQYGVKHQGIIPD